MTVYKIVHEDFSNDVIITRFAESQEHIESIIEELETINGADSDTISVTEMTVSEMVQFINSVLIERE